MKATHAKLLAAALTAATACGATAYEGIAADVLDNPLVAPRPHAARALVSKIVFGDEWTVVTIYKGAWGAATAPFINEAIASAIERCRTMSKRKLGCGANVVSIQVGWVVGLDCDGYSILATGLSRIAAIENADKKIETLRSGHSAHLKDCKILAAVETISGQDASVERRNKSIVESRPQ